jgi:hypothetical protein
MLNLHIFNKCFGWVKANFEIDFDKELSFPDLTENLRSVHMQITSSFHHNK